MLISVTCIVVALPESFGVPPMSKPGGVRAAAGERVSAGRGRTPPFPGGPGAGGGLEPPRLATLEPKSSASTSSATPARADNPARRRPPEARPITRVAAAAAKNFRRVAAIARRLPARWRRGARAAMERRIGDDPEVSWPASPRRRPVPPRRPIPAHRPDAGAIPAGPGRRPRGHRRAHGNGPRLGTGHRQGQGTEPPKPPAPAPEPAPPAGDAPTMQAASGKARLRPEPASETAIWCFDGRSSPPTIRVKLGQPVRLKLKNATDKPLSLHWHGVRNVNAMDGVGGVTQEPVPPGGEFLYSFIPPDAGTFLVRPLRRWIERARGSRPVRYADRRGGEPAPRRCGCRGAGPGLAAGGGRHPDAFGQTVFATSNGRLGNSVTVNGNPIPLSVEARPGSRLRLRLANGCNARGTRLRFDAVKVFVAAVDGQPTDTFEPLRATLPFPPGTRYDLIVDLPEEEGVRASVVATIARDSPSPTSPRRGEARAIPPADRAHRRKQEAAGRGEATERRAAGRRDHRRRLHPEGARFGRAKGQAGRRAGLYRRRAEGLVVNGTSATAGMAPIFSVKRGQVVVLALRNDTAFPQALHLHGHCFRLLHPAGRRLGALLARHVSAARRPHRPDRLPG